VARPRPKERALNKT